MKLKDVIQLFNLYQTVDDKKIPIKLAYKLNLLIEQYKPSMEFYKNEIHKIIDAFGLKDENNNYICTDTGVRLTSGSEKQVAEMINDLQALDAPLPSVWFDLEELEPLELTIQQLSPLMSCIKKPQD